MNKIVVTGGASGIGAAVVDLLAKKYEIHVFDIQKPQIDVPHYPIDITNAGAVEEAFKRVGGVTGLVHCAGVYLPAELVDMTDEQISKQIEVNLTGTALANKYALRSMVRGGVIINTASSLGVVPEPESPIYCASKAGIIMLTKALAQRYAGQQIRVNAILPGPIDTPLLREAFKTEAEFKSYEAENPMGRVGTPAEVAKLVQYLLSDDASYITGACIAIDGGESSSSLYSPSKR